MQNGNTKDEKRPTFTPVIVSKPALSHPVIDGNDTKQLLVCGSTCRLGHVLDTSTDSGRVAANKRNGTHFTVANSRKEVYVIQ